MQPSDESRAPRSGKVFVASGHMTDAPGRAAKGLGERFPEGKVDAVRERVALKLDEWGVGPEDLAVCGGARGADMIFAELCAGRGARVWLFLALPEDEFVEKSVRSPGTEWERRFRDLRARESVETFLLSESAGRPPEGESVFAQTNLWMLEAAGAEAGDPANIYALLVWDERPTGDGPGGTSDFAARVKKLGGHLSVINPTKL